MNRLVFFNWFLITLISFFMLGACDKSEIIEDDPISPLGIIDYDGNVYGTIAIGNQVWMTENLKVTHFSDGTPITLVVDSIAWANLNDDEKAYCYYANSTQNGNIYGALYSWAAAMNGATSTDDSPEEVQGVCPTGWHLPSDSEWKELETYLGMSQAEVDNIGLRGTNEGGQLKHVGNVWFNPNEGATNSSGFTGLPGGRRYHYATFSGIGCFGYWWSSNTGRSNYAFVRILNCTSSKVYRNDFPKSMGHSVRCVKDQ